MRAGFRIAGTFVIAAASFAALARASAIDFSSRPWIGGNAASAAAYQSNWENDLFTYPVAPAGYCDVTLAAWDGISNQSVCAGGSSNNIAFHETVRFGVTPARAGSWDIRIGPDFGLGGAVFLDGVALGFRSTDMWWNGTYTSATQIFNFTANLAYGNHVLQVYGFEACCDGASQAQFRLPGSTTWTTFAAADGINAVPEPPAPYLLLPGLAACAIYLRKRRRPLHDS